MNIVSYRGPCSPGGVSGTLSNVFDKWIDVNETWWHLSDSRFLARKVQRSPQIVCTIPESLVQGHYRFCNNVLWPILHDMPEYATVLDAEKSAYRLVNQALAWNIKRSEPTPGQSRYFVQDYQLALLPAYLSMITNAHTSVFWHVPWPQTVHPSHVPILEEIATGLLAAQKVGFHTVEYANNFLRFVQQSLADYSVDFENRTIKRTSSSAAASPSTEIVVHPLGIDFAFWTKQLNVPSPLHGMESTERFVLSVDRADYTKGILERFSAIEQFFLANPEWRGRVSFVQVCQRTRAGLSHFDQYWQACLAQADSINQTWNTHSWRPIVWIKDSLPPAVLAKLYHQAAACLVSPLRDGLNLTAKEFVACSDDSSGVLLLSRQAGAWHELGDHALAVTPCSKEQMASQISVALRMSQQRRKLQAQQLREKIKANSLSLWWQRFSNIEDSNATPNKLHKVEVNRRHLRELPIEASVVSK